MLCSCLNNRLLERRGLVTPLAGPSVFLAFLNRTPGGPTCPRLQFYVGENPESESRQKGDTAMFGLPVLDVAIGMAFVYLLFALMCTTINEIIASAFDRRAKMLRRGIRSLVGSEQLVDALYRHPAIASLAPIEKRGAPLPSYIPAARFVQALTDQFTGAGVVSSTSKLDPAALTDDSAKQLKAMMERSRDPEELNKRIEDWYEQTMDRVTGWYKRYVQRQTYALAIVLVLLLNLDSIHLIQRLWSDSALRSAVVEAAKTRIQESGGAEPIPVVEYTEGDKTNSGHPVQIGTVTFTDQEKELLSSLTGWQKDLFSLSAQRQLHPGEKWLGLYWLGGVAKQHLLGWILTVLALSLGAPFWFDTLNRFMNLRNAGRAPDEPRSKTT
jgi:hypothetical protein